MQNVDDLDRSIEERRVKEWLKMDSNDQQVVCNDVNPSDSPNPEPLDTVDAKPANGMSTEEQETEVEEILNVTVELNAEIVSNGSSNKANQNIDEDRRRRILGLPPLENSSNKDTEAPPANNDFVDNCKSEDVSKLKSLYEAKDVA